MFPLYLLPLCHILFVFINSSRTVQLYSHNLAHGYIITDKYLFGI